MHSEPIDPVQRDRVVGKVFKRLIWFLFILYVFSFLNRINISFAALSMNKSLGLTATMYALANASFYLGYILAEVPSNLMMTKLGARIWIPCIMVTWGIASAATMLSVGPHSLVYIRLIVGTAEGGFLPGVLLYLTFWFPQSYRARANAVFMTAQPIAIVFGSSISGLILSMSGYLGLAGWRWLFLLEGLPSAIIGVIAYFYLTDNPSKSKWLTPDERELLQRSLDREHVGEEHPTKSTIFRELMSRNVLLLMLSWFALVMTLSVNGVWLPQIVREGLAHRSFSFVGLITAVPAFFTVLTMPLWSRRSDRLQERRWHTVMPMALAATGTLMVAGFVRPELRLLGLVFFSIGGFCAMGVFWTLPPLFLSRAARPTGFAVINSVGIIGAILSPLMIGYLKDLTNSFIPGLLSVSAMLVVSAISILLVSKGSTPIFVKQPKPAGGTIS